MTTKPNPDPNEESIEQLAQKVTALRKRPLIVLFYPNYVSIDEGQVEYLSMVVRGSGLSRSSPLEGVDVLLHTFGGNPHAAYRIAQVIRNYAKSVEFIIPEYAYSAGTLMSLAADKILLGENAVLSPFDIKLVSGPLGDPEAPSDTYADESPEEEVELVAIDHFIQVAKQARVEIERAFRQRGWRSSKTTVESDMLCEMVRQVGALTMANYYREKNVAQAYAAELLENYMFSGGARSRQIDEILRRLIVEAPSHEFPMDYHICKDVGLEVEELLDGVSDAATAVTKFLTRNQRDTSLFPDVVGRRLPLFFVAPYTPAAEPDISATGVPAVFEEIPEEATTLEAPNEERPNKEGTSGTRRRTRGD